VKVESEGGGSGYIVGHSSHVVAFTRDNLAHVIYPFGTRQADWAHDLPRLATERWGGPASEPARADIAVSDAYVAEPLSRERTALYFTVKNGGGSADDLTSVSTTVARVAEVHRTVTHGTHGDQGGMVGMEPVASLPVPARGTLRLAPGGFHVMLLDLLADLQPGDSVEITVGFRRAGKVVARALVVRYAEIDSVLAASSARSPGER
jgi:copper(I)-binding protein